MLPTNILQRIFRVRCGAESGTCFAIEVDSRQYLVTAKHVLRNFKNGSNLDVFYRGKWGSIDAHLVGHAADPIDVSVFTLPIQIAPTYPIGYGTGNLYFAQDVYFLGFPYEVGSEVGEMNRYFPLPFVKKGILSTLPMPGDVQVFYLDGHVNPGFSGGPVVFRIHNTNDFKILSVLQGYISDFREVVEAQAKKRPIVQENSGIIVSYGINYAQELIAQNPIGVTTKGNP